MSIQLASLLFRSVENAAEFRAWLNDAEVFVGSLPDKSKDETEVTNTHNSGELARVVERLHNLANMHVPEVAGRCTLPGQPKRPDKAEVLGNLRVLAQACTSENAFLELINAAQRYGEEESEVVQALIAQSPQAGNQLGGRHECWPRTQVRLDQWQRLVDTALLAADRTGFSVVAVDRRVQALNEIVRKILLWKRDGPPLFQNNAPVLGRRRGGKLSEIPLLCGLFLQANTWSISEKR